MNKILEYGAIRAGDFREKKAAPNSFESDVEFHDAMRGRADIAHTRRNDAIDPKRTFEMR